MSFKKSIFIFLLFLIIIFPLFSEDANSVLFLNSNPINCTVKLDNKKIKQKTPLLLKNIGTGKHTVEIIKKGFAVKKEEIMVYPKKNNIYSYKMDADKLEAVYRKETYRSYPNQRFIDSLNIVIPVMAGFSAALTYNEISNPRYSEELLSPFVYSTYAVNTVFIGADIALHIHRNNYISKQKRKKEIINNRNIVNNEEESQMIFEKGNKAFQEESFDEAIDNYREILNNYTESSLFPSCMYKSAVINMINEEYSESLESFKEIINNYPEAELYDKALKNMADIYTLEGDYKKAVSAMNDILYVNNLYSKKEIEKRITEIQNMEKGNRG